MAEKFFDFERLPAELRMKIYPLSNNLALQEDSSIPALLRALISKPALFAEALSLYHRCNHSISAIEANTPRELMFKAMRMVQIMKIRHLRLVWKTLPSNYKDGDIKEFTLNAHKILLINNFESLTFAYEKGSQFLQSRILLEYLMNASQAGVKRVVLRLGDAARMTKIKSRLDKFSGTDGYLVSREYRNTRNAGRIEVWQWESDIRMPTPRAVSSRASPNWEKET